MMRRALSLGGQGRGRIGRISVSGADQVVSSGSNAVVPLTVAGLLSPDAFGFFMISWIAYTALLTVSRAVLGSHIALSAPVVTSVRRETGISLTLLTFLGPGIVVAVLAGPLAAGSELTWSLGLFAVGCWFALAEDALRYSWTAQGRASRALAGDSLWLGFVGISVLLRIADLASEEVVIGMWVTGAFVSFLSLLRGGTSVVGPRAALAAARESLGPRLNLSVAAISSGTSLVVSSVLISNLAGADVVAALAGAGQLFAPVSMSIALIPILVLPISASRDRAQSQRLFGTAAVLLGALALAWTVVLLLVPETLGVVLLGETWHGAREVLGYLGATTASVAIGIAGGSLFVRLGRTKFLANSRLVQAVSRIAIVALLAAHFGTAQALAAGQLAIAIVFAAMIWSVSQRQWREDTSDSADAPDGTDAAASKDAADSGDR